MAGMFSEDLKRRVRDANNLVDVVQAAVGKLTRAGRNLKACCPFHNEKSPSFNVNAEGQYFKCFGCGKSGDVFTFVQLHERIDFPEAFRMLADRAGIRVEVDPQAAAVYKKETDWKSYLYKINEAAAKFFREQLFSDAGKPAREYLKKRGLSDEVCERFHIGYAPQGGSPLLERLRSMKAPIKAIVEAGLATQRDDGSVRDFFYDRLMFPISNIEGKVIAFGARILGIGEPKYLNTRDTLLFSKTRTVYGIDHAKPAVVESRKAVLVEGYTDVMMCHQFGITNVVACLGTAITPDHVRTLRRVADELLLLTDSDAAGAKASERSIAVLFAEEMPAKVLRLPGADKDPCDFLLAHGKDPFVEAMQKPIDLFEYKFEMTRVKHDLKAPLGIKNAADELMSVISTIPDTMLKNQYRYEVLKRLNIDERDLRYETRNPAAPAAVQTSNDDAMTGVLPPAENELASAERELLRFLFHQPAWLEQAISQLDLNALCGKPESRVGRSLLKAIAEGKLPPDIEAMTGSDAGSIVAREVLERLRESEEDGQTAPLASAQALCVALAETAPVAGKLEPALRFEMLLKPVLQATLNRRMQDANRRWTDAKLSGDKAAEETEYAQVVQLRKQMMSFRSMGPLRK